MDYAKEIGRRDKRIEDSKKEIASLKEEIEALRQLLDCAAANLALAVKERGGKFSVSKEEVSRALGAYYLKAKNDGNGNYLLELVSR